MKVKDVLSIGAFFEKIRNTLALPVDFIYYSMTLHMNMYKDPTVFVNTESYERKPDIKLPSYQYSYSYDMNLDDFVEELAKMRQYACDVWITHNNKVVI